MEIGVLMGGISNEREISILSGQSVAAGLRRAGHQVSEIIVQLDFENMIPQLKAFDVLFNALHGAFGEDGQIQALLDKAGIIYTGCGVEASRILMDKTRSKEKLAQTPIPTPAWFELTETKAIKRPAGFDLPVVVKPPAAGSSVDVIIAHTEDEFQEAVRTVLKSSDRALVEEFIQGRELTVGVLGDTILPIIELRTQREFFDYTAKYMDDNTEYLCPAPVSSPVWKQAEEYTARAFDVFKCRDLVRFDFILATDNTLYFLEGNTIPGFTDHSLVPMAAGVAGFSFEKVCETIVEMALRRSRKTVSMS